MLTRVSMGRHPVRSLASLRSGPIIVAGVAELSATLEHFTIRLILPVSLPGLTRSRACPTSALNVEIGNIRFRCNPVSPGRWLLDRPVKPGDDSAELGQRNRRYSKFNVSPAAGAPRPNPTRIRFPAIPPPPSGEGRPEVR